MEKFKEYKDLVENLSKNKIKTLRSNNRGEFTSNEFNYLCKEVRIKREITTPYNPQKNGLVEMKNKSIKEAVKAMIKN